MAEFAAAVERILKWEGGYVDDPDDPGGATKWGISTRWLRAIGDPRDVASLSQDGAIELYRAHWWHRYGYGEIESQAVAERVFGLAIHAGPMQAHKVLQRALRANGQSQVFDDGLIGGITLRAIPLVDEKSLVVAWRSEMAGFYRVLLAKDPVREKWKRGWLRRAYEDDQ
jgi:lysozyme family protein